MLGFAFGVLGRRDFDVVFLVGTLIPMSERVMRMMKVKKGHECDGVVLFFFSSLLVGGALAPFFFGLWFSVMEKGGTEESKKEKEGVALR